MSACSDLRGFLDLVRRERPRDLVEVSRQVSPKFETAAILTKFEQSFRLPILWFRSIAGSQFPVVTNVCGSVGRLGLALQCSASELPEIYAERCAHPIKPAITATAPVQERVFVKADVDLGKFPQLVYHMDDSSNAYITAAIVVARDPETGKTNLSFHRLMMRDRNTTGIFMAHGKHLDQIYRKYEALGQAMPIAAFIGVHPTCSIGALYTGSADVEEYDIIGGLRGSPLPLTRCVTNDLSIPAEAEFGLEGFVPPRERVDEGPFGEFTGYSAGSMPTPVFNVEAITSRIQPLYQDIVSGHAEHLLLPTLGMEYNLLRVAREVAPTTTSVRLVLPLTAFVSLRKSDDSEPRRVIDALLATDIYLKQVIVVNADVDVSDLRQVSSAVALHVRPDRDVFIKPHTPLTELDPACDSQDGFASKLGIDATVSCSSSRRITKNLIPQHLLDSINLSEFLTAA